MITQYIVSFCTFRVKMYEIFTIDFCVKHRTYFQYRIKHKNRIQSKKSLTLLKPDLVMEGNIYYGVMTYVSSKETKRRFRDV